MADPMGGCVGHSTATLQHIIESLWNHPTTYIQFAQVNRTIAGMAVCFFNFSTFKGAPFLNIHDLIVVPTLRQSGIGTALLHGVTLRALETKCCKITLEVRNDNHQAQRLYQHFGFRSCAPPMEYLSKNLS